MQFVAQAKNPASMHIMWLLKKWDKSDFLEKFSRFLEMKLGFIDIFWRISK